MDLQGVEALQGGIGSHDGAVFILVWIPEAVVVFRDGEWTARHARIVGGTPVANGIRQ